MKPLTLSQSAEIAAFAETYAEERFGRKVRVSVSGFEETKCQASVIMARGLAGLAFLICLGAGANPFDHNIARRIF